ncbi:MAG: hypothetical protein AAFX79_08245 [Planctomycetota bacterium]
MFELLILVIVGYLGVGLLVAIPMAIRGVNRFDGAARDGTWGFRVLAIPGLAVLWPLVLLRWISAGASS